MLNKKMLQGTSGNQNIKRDDMILIELNQGNKTIMYSSVSFENYLYGN